MLRRIGPLLIAVGGIGCSVYQPGSFATKQRTTFAGQRTTVGCLDISVERRKDHEGAAVLAYKFGNRCDHKQMVDLTTVPVIGRAADGAEHSLAAFDPASEIRPLAIDARLVGGEVLAYHARVELVQVCVDVAAIARAASERWLCFAREADPVQDAPADAVAPSERVVELDKEVRP